ncbi:hypothetical protein BT96DRAFT_994145 [Gymnopus androsaceus JB14]|uniref:Uncharacterized protein n=1 Tax=Gymnopus androsaceus JB14 TaxID=1447944 RepID=A0A6A4HQZ7_9AGAR|nr:hypothetical protein BT96DRAFT_994145 [Gymnopus androsaceus JB14]
MPRIRTESAIKKSLITPEQKAENRKNNRAKANRQYRLRKRASMDYVDYELAKHNRKQSDKRYYLKNRDKILDNARWARINEWTENCNGNASRIYKCRNGTKRIGKESAGARIDED